jgi:hypothetical protein
VHEASVERVRELHDRLQALKAFFRTLADEKLRGA